MPAPTFTANNGLSSAATQSPDRWFRAFQQRRSDRKLNFGPSPVMQLEIRNALARDRLGLVEIHLELMTAAAR